MPYECVGLAASQIISIHMRSAASTISGGVRIPFSQFIETKFVAVIDRRERTRHEFSPTSD